MRTILGGMAVAVIATGLLAADGLTVSRATLHQYEGGPALAAGQGYQPGDTVFLVVQVAGHGVSPDNKVFLEYEWAAVDPQGVPLTTPFSGKVAEELHPEDKDWKPTVKIEFPLPPKVLPGNSQVKLTVKDNFGKGTLEKTIPVPVQGKVVEPSATLVLRNFGYYKTEDAPSAMLTPTYRPGETIFAKFDITGYKLGEANKYTVKYGLTVKNAEGRVMLSQPDAATLSQDSFYPQRWVPGGFRFTTPADTKPGEYTATVSLRDEVGGTQAEATHGFRVEP